MKINIYYLIFAIAVFLCSCEHRYPIDLGLGFRIQSDISVSYIDALMYPDGTSYAVVGHIVDHSFDKKYIIVAQKPWDDFIESHHYQQAKEFKKYKFRQYWIIDKYKQKTYGPFTKDQYLDKKKELGVPDTLKLQFERQR